MSLDRKTHLDAAAILTLVACCAIWGVSQVAAKVSLTQVPPLLQAGFRVLVTAYMPAVLVEIGFGSNPAEAAYLSDAAKQRVIAAAIADAAMQYLDRYDSRVKGTAGAGRGPSR